MCKNMLRNKVREQLLGVTPLESGAPLVLKLMLDIVMDVNDSTLRFLTQNLQTLWMKDVPGENVGTIVSYLKGHYFYLKNCKKMPTYVMVLLNDTLYSTACDEVTDFYEKYLLQSQAKTYK